MLEAQLAAEKLRKFGIKLIYSSDLTRDIQTANIIGGILGNIPCEVDYGLRTANMGELSGQLETDVEPFVNRWYHDTWIDAPSGESYQDFCARFDKAWMPKVELAKDIESFRPVLIVGHGRNGARLQSYLDMVPPWKSRMPMPGGIGIISLTADGLEHWEFDGGSEPVLDDQ